ncbi:hypothetical protein NBRC116494_19940 [Aurantivibrio plasticivorans]
MIKISKPKAAGMLVLGVLIILFVDHYPHLYRQNINKVPYIEGKLTKKDTRKVVDNPYSLRHRAEYYQAIFVMEDRGVFYVNNPSNYETNELWSKVKYNLNYRFYSAACEYEKEACHAVAIKNMERDYFPLPFSEYVDRAKTSDKVIQFMGLGMALVGALVLAAPRERKHGES